jgi:glycosyltransferase involved in cell wall biosynthesis
VRILLVNAFHYLRGGVERTYLDESRWLEARGHQVAHLAIRDPKNLPSPTGAHFAPAAEYGEGTPVLRLLSQMPRAIWSRPAADCMAELVREFRPDVAHLHAPSRYLTPAVLRPLERAGVPVVMTLHDFKPWCTNRILFAHGRPCERCRGGRHWKALATGCVQSSRARSAVAMVEAYVHDAIGAYRAVKLWIAPSRFVLDKAIEFGVPRARLRVLGHGVEPSDGAADAGAPPAGARPFVLFYGRLSLEKGVRVLPEVASKLPGVEVRVAGRGPLGDELERAAASRSNLKLLGYLPDAELSALRARAGAVLVPSLFYEHYCYTAAEALLDRRPVVATRIGAIPELVEHEVTGLLAGPGDAAGLASAIERALSDPRAHLWAAAGRDRVMRESSPESHVGGLLEIYREAIGSR